MNRKTATRAALVGLPLAAFLLYAALNWYRLEEEEIRIGAGEAAQENPYLAFERFLGRMDAASFVARVPSALDAPPPRGTLLLAGRRLAYMTPARVRAIARWVDAGGSLVVEAERESIDDPLLDAFGVQRVHPEGDARNRRRNTGPGAYAGAGAVLTIDWPQLKRPLRARIGTASGELRDTRVRSDVREVRQGKRLVALDFASGEGRVTILPTLAFLRNGQVGEYDHAELGWRLVARQPPAMLYLRMQSPPLLEWVQRDAWPVALAALLLLVLWLGRIIPRFGPLEPAGEAPRRSLVEHVAASGRFLWSRGAGENLLDAVSERASREARKRGVATQSIATKVPGLATARLDAAAFTSRMASLQEIEQRLARKGKK